MPEPAGGAAAEDSKRPEAVEEDKGALNRSRSTAEKKIPTGFKVQEYNASPKLAIKSIWG